MKVLIVLIILSLIIGIFICCNIKFREENFTMDYSCDVIQNKYYDVEELHYKSKCPNLVIVEKNIYGNSAFFAEQGDYKGPYFSNDFITYYYMGLSPQGTPLNLEYDLYSHPWYNPRRWIYGRYSYYPRNDYHWGNNWYNPWNNYNKRINNPEYRYKNNWYNKHWKGERGKNRIRNKNFNRVENRSRTSINKNNVNISKPRSLKYDKTLGRGGKSAGLW